MIDSTEIPEEYNEEPTSAPELVLDIDASIKNAVEQARVARDEAENLLDMANMDGDSVEMVRRKLFLSTAVPLVTNDIHTSEMMAATLIAGKQVSDSNNLLAQVNLANIERLENIAKSVERLSVAIEGIAEVTRHMSKVFETFAKTKKSLDDLRNKSLKRIGDKK